MEFSEAWLKMSWSGVLSTLVGVSAVYGSLALFYTAGQLLRYIRAVLSANVYETGVIHEYDEDFDEDNHSSFNPLPPLSGEEAVGGVLAKKEELKLLRSFVRQQVFPLFKDHCDDVHGGRHFAVLMLCDQPLSSQHRWTFYPLTPDGRPYIDSKYCTRPPRHLYGDYVVARPQLHKVPDFLRKLTFHMVPEVFYDHAEAMLLNEFDTLWECFETSGRHGGTNAHVIFLFSWLFPCDRCTSLAIEKFGMEFRQRHPTVQRIILAFAIFWRRMSFQENWKNFERLRNSGFDIVRVKLPVSAS